MASHLLGHSTRCLIHWFYQPKSQVIAQVVLIACFPWNRSSTFRSPHFWWEFYACIHIYIHTHNVHIYIYTYIYIYIYTYIIYTYIYTILYYIIIYPKNEKLNSNVLVNQYSTVHVWARRPGRLRNAKVRAQLLTRSALSWGQGDHSDHSGRYFSL